MRARLAERNENNYHFFVVKPNAPRRPTASAPAATDAGGHLRTNRSALPIRRIDSSELLDSAAELIIVHAGREYRLRVTSNGKLILTA